jgi:DNA-binding MarR family transcriptional regulator
MEGGSVVYDSDMNDAQVNTEPAEADGELRRAASELHALARKLLRMARRDLEQHLETRGVGIGALAYRVVRLLHDQESLTISELSQQLAVSPPTLVAIVDGLEQKGMVERGHDARDRRRTPLALTAIGQTMIAQIPVVDEEDCLLQGLASLGIDKRRELVDLLRELTGAMSGDRA